MKTTKEGEETGEEEKRFKLQLNPAIAYFKGQVKIMLYTEVLFIANINNFKNTSWD